MKRKHCWHGNKEVLHTINKLPRKIISMQNKQNLVEFVIHELCNYNCFNLSKAAYIVDNPDFDFMKGIAGYCKDEEYSQGNIWDAPDDFSTYMNQCSFNKKVRGLQYQSSRRRESEKKEIVDSLAKDLGMQTYGCCDIPLKNNNYGLFIYEYMINDEDDHQSFLDGISLLGFCPIY